MNESDGGVAAVMNEIYEPSVLPDHYSDYEIISCLKKTDDTAVYLVQKQEIRYILKNCRRVNEGILKNEYETLCSLDFTFLPRAIEFYQGDDGNWLLREYAEGMTLSDTVERFGVMPEHAAIDVILKLCGVLNELHSLSPPIIHRDIKPQNIVMNTNGKLMIIDMGTARTLKENASNDTVIMGTDAIAAPEQFGYAQTDERTDIYAVGLFLAFLLTGNYNAKKADLSRVSRRMKAVIKTCSAFDPDKRFQSVQELERALITVITVKKRIMYATVIATVVCITVIVISPTLNATKENAGIPNELTVEPTVGASFESTETVTETALIPTPVVFTEPLIEKAARYALGFDGERVVYEEDLLKVTSMLIIADECADYVSHRWGEWRFDPDMRETWMRRGRSDGIASLEDMRYFKNMRKLGLIGQNITDLSPLSELPLESLWLGLNPVENILPLHNCVTLTELYLDAINAVDIGAVVDLRNLTRLALDYMDVTDLSPLADLALTELHLEGIQTGRDYSVLTRIPLRQLITTRLEINQLESVYEIKSLEYLFSVDMGFEIESIERFAELPLLKSLLLYDSNIKSLDGAENMPNLEEIEFGVHQYERIMDITPLTKAPNLKTVGMSGVEAADYLPLLEIQNLETIQIAEKELLKLYEAIPDPPFEIVIRNS